MAINAGVPTAVLENSAAITPKICAALISFDHLCEYFYVGMPGASNGNCVCCNKGYKGAGPSSAGYTVYRLTDWDDDADFMTMLV